MRLRLPRPLYILWRFIVGLGKLISQGHNAAFCRGSTAQTTSSHAHKNPRLWLIRRIANAIFFWQADHCAESWEDDVKRAKHTLAIHLGVDAERIVITVSEPATQNGSIS